MLYRIAEPADWQQAQASGFFASADLTAEGFIHTSTREQVLETARRYYPGRAGLLLLEVDETVLLAAGVVVKRELAASRGEYFAHIFGPIPLTAIRRSWPFSVEADGQSVLPPSV